MGGGGGDSTTTMKADPWISAQTGLRRSIHGARDLYADGGFAPDPYGGDRVANQSAGSVGAYNSVMGRGAGSPMVSNAYGGIDQLMRGQTPYSAMMSSDPRLAGMAKSDPRLASMAKSDPRLASLMKSDPRLASMMSGNDIYRDLGTVKQNALGSAIPAAMSMFSGNGMTDSSAAMDTVGRAATEAVAPIDYGAWQAAQDRRLQAVGQDDASRLSAIGLDDATRMGAIGQDAQTRMGAIGQDAGTRLSAYGLGQQGQLGAAGMAPGLQAASYLPAQMMAQFGGQRDAYNQSNIDARMGKYYEGQNQRRDNLLGYGNFMSQMGGQGSAGQQTGPNGQPSTGAKIGAAGLGGLGTYGALAAIPGIGAPLAIGGGALAALMGLL
jgi:hypothetical protein